MHGINMNENAKIFCVFFHKWILDDEVSWFGFSKNGFVFDNLFRQFGTAIFEQLWFESLWLLCFHIGSSFLQLVIFKKRLNNFNIASSNMLQAICLNIIKISYYIIFKKKMKLTSAAPVWIVSWVRARNPRQHLKLSLTDYLYRDVQFMYGS